MTVFAEKCAEVLYDIGVKEDEINVCRELFLCRSLSDILSNPTVKQSEKKTVIKKLFPTSAQGFITLLCAENLTDEALNVFDAFFDELLRRKNYVSAEFSYVTEPDDLQKSKIKEAVCKLKNADGVKLICRADKSLIGGYCLKIGDIKYEKSIRSGLDSLRRALKRG